MIRLIILCLSFVYLNSAYAEVDRLEQLSKTLSQGSHRSDDRLEQLSRTLNRGAYQQSKNQQFEWVLNCSKDRFENTKTCYLAKRHLIVILVDGNYYILIGTNHYPRSKSALKIDDNKTLYGTEGGIAPARAAIEQMKGGRVAYTRYRKWPNNHNLDGEVDLGGFSSAFREMLRWYSRL